MKERNGRLVVMTLASLILLTASMCWAAPKNDDAGKAATVNGKIISKSDFDSELGMALGRASQAGKTPSGAELADLKTKVLENLINLELLSQESKKEGIQVDQKKLDQECENFKKEFPTPEEFNGFLKKNNLTEAGIKDKLKILLGIQEFIDKKFGQKVVVSDQETKAFYDGNPNFFKVPEQVHASHILVKVAPNADAAQKAAARKKIEGIQKQLKNGGDFAALAKTNSECPSNAQGGDLGYFPRGQMSKPFEDAAFSLTPGQMSGIVETEFGFHIIKVLDKKPGKTMTFDEVKVRLAAMLKNQKVGKEVEQYLEKLKKDAKIERFLK